MTRTLAITALTVCACAEPQQAAPAAPATSASPAAEAPASTAEADPEAAAIRQTALDYIEGWYEGNGDRMARALHPELAKRIVRTNSAGTSRLSHMTAEMLIDNTRKGGGKDTPADRQLKEVTVLDIFEGAASAKIVASDWIDYLQLARFDGRWVIVNVLWELKP